MVVHQPAHRFLWSLPCSSIAKVSRVTRLPAHCVIRCAFLKTTSNSPGQTGQAVTRAESAAHRRQLAISRIGCEVLLYLAHGLWADY